MVASVHDLVKRYGGRTVLDGLTFDIRRGELLALLGPNGAGKTTTIEILEGYRRLDGGFATVLGRDPWRAGGALTGRVGLMLQGGGIYPQARPLEILRLHARFFGTPHDPAELLDLVGLRHAARTRYRVLSGGERQRLGLALALVGRPELLFLDEPTAGMDPAAKAATRALIGDLRTAGVTILLTTHELADIERLADRVAIIDRGRLVALGSPAELTAGAAPSVRLRLDRPPTPGAIAALAASIGERFEGGRVAVDGASGLRVVGVPPSPAVVERIAVACRARDLLIVELRTSAGSLEERYLELVGGDDEDVDAGEGASA
ncbi:MAG: ABC transporter ATP-binding protein [Chloroflexi bacterium]|nr:ABC transporter ATP-binding protein [Chloroflexota bacterium]